MKFQQQFYNNYTCKPDHLPPLKLAKKMKVLLEKLKRPLPPLPVKELSEYEKIREDFIAQRKREWLVYEKKWEKQWEVSKQNK